MEVKVTGGGRWKGGMRGGGKLVRKKNIKKRKLNRQAGGRWRCGNESEEDGKER